MVDNKYRGVPFWSWNGDLDKERLLKQIDFMRDKGFGGFFMHARAGLVTPYLSDKWFELIQACTERANEYGMHAYVYDENGWPSGFAGGKLLSDKENLEYYLTSKISRFDKTADVSFEIKGDTLVRVTDSKARCLNIYVKQSKSTVDILNPEVIKKFITVTHKKYQSKIVSPLQGFFTDEPQVHDGDKPFSYKIAEYFAEKYNQDIFDGIGLLFLKKKGYRSFRYKYYKAMQELMLFSYGKQIYDWCDQNGYKLTGHYYEERSLAKQVLGCGGVMPFYEYMHIPGIDYLGRFIEQKDVDFDKSNAEFLANEISPKQVGSVAAQLGKKQVLSESMAMCGWKLSPIEMKKLMEYQYVNGVNLTCLHLLPYSECGQRKWDYPLHFSSCNPWVDKGLKEYNDYFAKLGEILTESVEIVNVGVVQPVRSAYFDYDRDLIDTGFGTVKLDDAFKNLVEKLGAKNIPHHYIDETLLAKHGRVEGNKLVLGNCKYEYIILPLIYTMDATTNVLLKKFVKNGGKILLTCGKPKYLEGEPYDYDYLTSNVTLSEIRNAQPVYVKNGSGIRTTLRRDERGNEFIYALNLGEKTTVDFRIKGVRSFKAYDILNDETTVVSKTIEFDKNQSYLLYFSNAEPSEKKGLQTLRLGNYTLAKPVDNYLLIDFLRYSFDGKEYSQKVYTGALFDRLLQDGYCGELYLKYNFDVLDVPNKLRLITENNNVKRVVVNGVSLKADKVLDDGVLSYDIAELVKRGENQVVVRIDYYQKELVYQRLFGKDVTDNLKNCLTYDTTIEPIYLIGDFGVDGKFEKGRADDVVVGCDFKITKQKDKITSVCRDGFPFLRGEIRLKTQVNLTQTNYQIVFDKPFQLIELFVNGKKAHTLVIDNKADISQYLVEGENVIEIALTVGNRNLLGVLHSVNQDEAFTYAGSFTLRGYWKDWKSNLFSEKYYFIEPIV